MEKEPLLPLTLPAPRKKLFSPSNSTSLLWPLPEDSEIARPPFSPNSPSSPFLKDRLIYGPHPAAAASSFSSSDSWEDEIDGVDPSDHPEEPRSPTGKPEAKVKLHRSRTAPAMSNVDDADAAHVHLHHPPEPRPRSTPIVRQAVILLAVYLSLGVLIYTLGRRHFDGQETHPVVDAIYFCVVTMCTIGYGDITPRTPSAKLFSVAFVLVGFGFVDVLLSGMVSYVLDLQEALLLSAVKGGGKARSYLVDVKKGRMRIRMKVGLALGVVVLCVGVGAGVMRFVEGLGWLDAVYLSVMSVTTVGYGDRAFESMPGRLFASVWLLVSTLAVARAFLYLAEARIDKRHRMIAKWVLSRDMTVAEFLAADIDQNGSVSKSEYVIYKLKEMGSIAEKDILPICAQFDRVDKGRCGKITLSDLIESHQ
ncbi:hypothetical protein Taro_033565 [Colocasia esculenta]|uniref:Potassium channel domain-containing protein n=1 Tax=Colocasia esculenta TaxID=4460 RepID=A0A843W537_COLES|nr:hypothetical protein [Colocasia esculenta]